MAGRRPSRRLQIQNLVKGTQAAKEQEFSFFGVAVNSSCAGTF